MRRSPPATRAETAGHAALTLAGQVCGPCRHELLLHCEVPASEVPLGSCGRGPSGHRCGRQARLAAPLAPALASGLGRRCSPAAPHLQPVCQDLWLPELCGEPPAGPSPAPRLPPVSATDHFRENRRVRHGPQHATCIRWCRPPDSERRGRSDRPNFTDEKMEHREPTSFPQSHTAKKVAEPGLELRPWDPGACGPTLLGTSARDTLTTDTCQARAASRVLL